MIRQNRDTLYQLSVRDVPVDAFWSISLYNAAGYFEPNDRHCRRCQRRSGAAASPSAHAAVESLRIAAGDDVLRCWKPDDGGEK